MSGASGAGWFEDVEEGGRRLHVVFADREAALDALDRLPQEDFAIALTTDAAILASELDPKGGRRAAKFWPEASWAEARNLGCETARALGARVDYAVFVDGDAAFAEGDYRGFVAAVDAAQPMFATPRAAEGARGLKGALALKGAALQVATRCDLRTVAFHRDALANPHLWPIPTKFDSASQEIARRVQEYFILHHYGRQIIQFNGFARADAPEAGPSSPAREAEVQRAAFQQVARTLGRRADFDGDAFPDAQPVTFGELLDRLSWRLGGRRSRARRPLDRHGAPLALSGPLQSRENRV